MARLTGNLGEYLKEQRSNAQLSIRQLAAAAGVSNPYLSQIERGLRRPSAEILQQIAKALRISAEQLYVQAGILDVREDDAARDFVATVVADASLTSRQRQVLMDVYASFREQNHADGRAPQPAAVVVPTDAATAAHHRAPSEHGTTIARERTSNAQQR